MKKLALLINALLFTTIAMAQLPDLTWAKQFGGSALSLAVDDNGNIFTLGGFADTADVDPGPGVSNLVSAGSSDIFISKLDASGNLVWARKFGGTAYDEGTQLQLDAAGNIYFTGYFTDTADFDPGAGVLNLVSAGSNDVFVVKLDASGDLLRARQFGGTSFDRGLGLWVNATGNVYTVGRFENTVDFDPGANTNNMTSAGGADAFISKLDPSGNFVWAKQFGGTGQDISEAITLDNLGNIYTTGNFADTVDFDPDLGATFNLTHSGIFVSKLDANGDFVWAKEIGGTGRAFGYAIAVDSASNVYTTGNFFGMVDFNPGSAPSDTFFMASIGQFNDVFVSKLDTDGNFVWANKTGGLLDDIGFSIVIDIAENAYISGTLNFDAFSGVDGFIAKMDVTGGLEWKVDINRVNTVSGLLVAGQAITLDASNNIYTTGYFNDTAVCNLNTGQLKLIPAKESFVETYLLKLNEGTTAIADIGFANDFLIYPNPTQGLFAIQVTNHTDALIEVYDAFGKLLYHQAIVSESETIDLRNHSRGLYLVTLTTKTGYRLTKKVLVVE